MIPKYKTGSSKGEERNIVKGIELMFQDDSNVYSCGLEDGPGTTIEEFNLEDGEYICFVRGRCEWYVHQLCFITNKGRTFGPIGDTGGSKFSTVQQIHRVDSKCDVIHIRNMFLKGICANQVRTRQGYLAIARLQFCLGIISDSSVILENVVPSAHDIAIEGLLALEY